MDIVKTLEQQMAVYAAYHRHPVNRLTHFVGVPMILFAVFIPLGWLRLPIFGMEISTATLLVALVSVYYYVLDRALALAMVAFMVGMLFATELIASHWSVTTGFWIFLTVFIVGWTFQLIGHVVEGRRPALVDNLWQVVIAPIFLMAEIFFAAGLKLNLKRRVQALVGNSPG